jgi:hypothetical protein
MASLVIMAGCPARQVIELAMGEVEISVPALQLRNEAESVPTLAAISQLSGGNLREAAVRPTGVSQPKPW